MRHQKRSSGDGGVKSRCLLRATYCLLPTAYCLLPAACYLRYDSLRDRPSVILSCGDEEIPRIDQQSQRVS